MKQVTTTKIFNLNKLDHSIIQKKFSSDYLIIVTSFIVFISLVCHLFFLLAQEKKLTAKKEELYPPDTMKFMKGFTYYLRPNEHVCSF